MIYMLDTDICIEIIRHKPSQIIDKIRSVPFKGIGISAITAMELEKGIHKSHYKRVNRIALDKFLDGLEVASFDQDAAAVAAEVIAKLEIVGKIIGAYDMLIAGHAKNLNVTLVTNNVREFHRISGLKMENWMTE